MASRHGPLAGRIVADSEEANVAVAPGLVGTPLDQVEEPVAHARTQGVELPRAVAAAPFVRSDDGIALACPVPRVRHFPR